MKIGLIGAGNMGGALARGFAAAGAGELLVTDALPERARSLAEEVGGRAVGSNADLAAEADLVVLCHKPAQLGAVAGEASEARSIATILGGTPVADVEAAYPGIPVYRFMPSIPVEVRRAVLCYVPGSRAGEGPEREVLELFGEVGVVIALDEALMDAATAVMSCGVAFYALVLEALIDAGVSRGLQPADAQRMAVATMAGTATVLEEGGDDPATLRRRVTSPGGMTARGIAALERGGLRAAFQDAVDAVAGPRR